MRRSPQIHTLPVDRIKIDKNFINTMVKSGRTDAIVDTIAGAWAQIERADHRRGRGVRADPRRDQQVGLFRGSRLAVRPRRLRRDRQYLPPNGWRDGRWPGRGRRADSASCHPGTQANVNSADWLHAAPRFSSYARPAIIAPFGDGGSAMKLSAAAALLLACSVAARAAGAGQRIEGLLAAPARPAGRETEARRLGLGAAHLETGPRPRLCRCRSAACDRLPQRRPHRGQHHLVGQGRFRNPERRLHHPRKGHRPPLADLRQCADALSATADLEGRRDARRQFARLPGQPRLRPASARILQIAVQDDRDGRHGRHRRKPRRPLQEARRRSADPARVTGHGAVQLPLGDKQDFSWFPN